MTLGERIKNFRHEEGLSQDALADKLNVSRQSITKWENNNGVPDIDNLIALRKLMGISLDELVMGEKGEGASAIKKQATNQRKQNSTLCLLSAMLFGLASVLWIISCVLNIIEGNDIAAIANALCVGILMIPIKKNLKRYFEIKEQ